jgi:hypothetical protein
MTYIKCRGYGLCLKCIVTNYFKHVYVNDLGGVYTYGVLVLGVLGSRVMIVVLLFWCSLGGGWGVSVGSSRLRVRSRYF